GQAGRGSSTKDEEPAWASSSSWEERGSETTDPSCKAYTWIGRPARHAAGCASWGWILWDIRRYGLEDRRVHRFPRCRLPAPAGVGSLDATQGQRPRKGTRRFLPLTAGNRVRAGPTSRRLNASTPRLTISCGA